MKNKVKLLVIILAIGATLQAVLSYAETSKQEDKGSTSTNKGNDHDSQPGP